MDRRMKTVNTALTVSIYCQLLTLLVTDSGVGGRDFDLLTAVDCLRASIKMTLYGVNQLTRIKCDAAASQCTVDISCCCLEW
jgi:hypothetical protein